MKRLFLCTLLLVLCSTPASAILDTNNNGMSDVWERIYNNGDLFPSSFDPLGDDDSDGWTNAEEAVAGTDPESSHSPDGMLRLRSSSSMTSSLILTITGSSFTLKWQPSPGRSSPENSTLCSIRPI